MLTPALSVTTTILSKEIENEKKEKMAKEAKEKEELSKENGTEETGEKVEGGAQVSNKADFIFTHATMCSDFEWAV